MRLLKGGVSLLSLIPRLIRRRVTVWWRVVGVAGWNTSAAWFRTCSGMRGRWLGTLLGPEKTPVWGVFLVPPPGLAVLTRFRCVLRWVWWCWVVWGVVVC